MNALTKLEDLENDTAVAEHLIDVIRGPLPGPTLLVMGGIHGNEPAGVKAAERVLPVLRQREAAVRGEIALLRGNTRALTKGVRYIDVDLNRQWRDDETRQLGKPAGLSEAFERDELVRTLSRIVERARGEVYFLDLHTTSASGGPFATVGDTLRNRTFALKFPLTIVLGLEEQIEGTLLEFMNNRGAVTLGFEAGQHAAVSAIDNDEAIIWSAIVAAGNLARRDVAELERFSEVLTRACGGSRVIEVRYRHAIQPEHNFRMEPGFTNFQPVKCGQLLANDHCGQIKSRETGLILMPVYQKLGDDGFFLAREVKRFWLWVSALLRKLRLGSYIHLLPGVRRDRDNPDVLIINTRVARFLPLQVFHLLGFRKLRWRDKRLIVTGRAFDLRGPARFEL